jgi:DNA-binding beta-propeller fold protein YncE
MRSSAATRSVPLRLAAVVIVAGFLAAACDLHGAPRARSATSPATTRSPPGASPPAAPAPWNDPATVAGPGLLAPGSDPAVLPAAVMIADNKNNRLVIVDPQGRVRWQFPQPGDLAPGQTFLVPDDAFFSPDGREIIATQEDDFVISVVDVATRRIVYRYGTPGQPGAGPDQLDNPDDAMLLPDGYVLTADIKNCRILLIPPGGHSPARIFGQTLRPCLHHPPDRFGSPNGAFPMADGDYLVTEINGDWVDELSLTGTVLWSTHPPDVAYPSDSNEIGPGRYLTVDYSTPGQVVIFDQAGRTLWRYQPTGAAALRNPSLALPLPGGDVILNDDFNHRVIVVDPHTDTVVWQYGHTGVASPAPGYLNNPDGIDLVPPYSLLGTHAATMGQP